MFESLAGKAILASPFLEDPNFFRTVVLMLQHSDKEALGLVLNRPTDFTLHKVVSMVCEVECIHDGWLHYGGPVDGPLIALHDSSSLGGTKLSDELWVTTDQEILKKLFTFKDVRFKLFDGLSGWGPGQLELELASGSWLISQIDDPVILQEDDCWDDLVKQIGDEIVLKQIDAPLNSNPELN
ncbi:YqgE/AlgH family protein [Pirellulaceae bacterium SH449]